MNTFLLGMRATHLHRNLTLFYQRLHNLVLGLMGGLLFLHQCKLLTSVRHNRDGQFLEFFPQFRNRILCLWQRPAQTLVLGRHYFNHNSGRGSGQGKNFSKGNILGIGCTGH
jgi:hypothetical protein